MATESDTSSKARPAGWLGAHPLDFAEKLRERPHPGKVRIELLTDPWSVWCWGFEPARRTLALRYPTIEFRFLLGGMFPTMPDPREVGFDIERFFSIVQRTTGMPIRADGIRRDPASSTYPACIFVHAARLADPSLELAFLRALREAVYLDGQNISRAEVASKIAARVGIQTDKFRDALSDGSAEAAFKAQLAKIHEQGLHGYPTFLIASGDRTVRVEGFQSLPGLLGIAQSVSGQPHAPLPDPDVASVLAPGERVATREFAEVFGISIEEAFERLSAMEAKGTVAGERYPTGYVWTAREGSKRPVPAKRTQNVVRILPER
jgi:protein-disulfide isomerase-like protein with CxxC motif